MTASLEREFFATAAVGLASGCVRSWRGRATEKARRAGLNGTSLVDDGHGRVIEYTLLDPIRGPHKTLILESGLGSPLESWDWITHLLRGQARILRYHRRGYGRTTSALEARDALPRLLTALQLDQDELIFMGHSLGSLVIAEALSASSNLRRRTSRVYLIDGTDGLLLERDRSDRKKVANYHQVMTQNLLAAITNMHRFGPNRLSREVEYRPDIQEALATFTYSPRTIFAARREFLSQATEYQEELASCRCIPVSVFASSENVAQERNLARRYTWELSVVPSSTHRSIIGKIENAELIAEQIKEGLCE